MSEIYRADDTSLRGYVAVKILPDEFPPDAIGDQRLGHHPCKLVGAAQPVNGAGAQYVSAYPFEEV